MPFFTLNFYTKGLILAILLAVGIWNRKISNDNVDAQNNQLASKQTKHYTSKNVFVTAFNEF